MEFKEQKVLVKKFLNGMIQVENKVFTGQYFSEYGLTTLHYKMMVELYFKGEMSISEIGRQLKVSIPNVSKYIEHLVKLGYVGKNPSKKDRRVVYIMLSQKGEKVFNEIMEKITDHIKENLDKLSQEEAKKLQQLLDEIDEILEKIF